MTDAPQNPSEATMAIKVKVGIFSMLGLFLVGAVTVFVNDRPFWWRPCQLVHINVEDATGLKTKSPIRSLGLQIGYLRGVELSETHVRLAICVTAPVEVLPSTRAFIRGEGFLGDKFVELKPVKYLGGSRRGKVPKNPLPHVPSKEVQPEGSPTPQGALFRWLFTPSLAHADPEDETTGVGASERERDIPVGEQSKDVQQLVKQVDNLVSEMTDLTANLKTAINPQEIKATMERLNQTLENAAKTLSPEGGLTTTAQRVLAKLEDAIEQLRDQLTRINQGQGSVGMVLNDPTYATELKEAIKGINRLLSKVSGMMFIVDIGGAQMGGYEGSRGWFQLAIWPDQNRYYLLGGTYDKRGSVTRREIVTQTGDTQTIVPVLIREETGLQLTVMLGKLFANRLDLALGLLHGDPTGSIRLYLGPDESENRIQLVNQIYTRTATIDGKSVVHDRVLAEIHPWMSLYFMGGLETVRKVNDKLAYTVGAGLRFDDQDVKMLFSFL